MQAASWRPFRTRSRSEVRIARSLVSVLFGFAVFFAIVRMLTAFAGSLEANGPVLNYLLLSVTLTIAAAVLGGYITARLAASHEFPHTAALGLLMVVMSFVSMRQEGISQPGWYQVTIAGCGPISAMIGAAIRLLTKGRQTSNGSS
jgi:hypothetical protein